MARASRWLDACAAMAATASSVAVIDFLHSRFTSVSLKWPREGQASTLLQQAVENWWPGADEVRAAVAWGYAAARLLDARRDLLLQRETTISLRTPVEESVVRAPAAGCQVVELGQRLQEGELRRAGGAVA